MSLDSKSKPKWMPLILSLGGLLLLSGLAHAQEPAGDEIFGEVIDVRVVNLEVVVTEKGERVRDLSPEDFVLTVDGEEIPIEYFTEVSGGTAMARDAAGDSTVPALAPGETVGTSYLVFIDEFFSIARDRDRVLNRMIEQLPNMSVADRMAVVAYDGKQIDMLSNWSQSVESLTRSLKKARDRPSRGLERLAQERLFQTRQEFEQLDGGQPAVAGPASNFDFTFDIEEEQYARLVGEQVERGIKAAAATLRSFANPPGRKVMLLLSGGWPADPALWVTADPVRAARANAVDRGKDLLSPLADTANRLSYTIYPVDVPGVSNVGVDASVQEVEDASLLQNRGYQREREEESTLYALASATGGQALVNSASTSAFERVVADTRSYYWLGFTPRWKGDDSGHRVKIDIRRKGLKVRTREGFSDLSRSTEVTFMVESALLFGDPPSAQPLVVQVGRGKRAGFGKRDVPLAVKIPIGSLSFIPSKDGWQAKTELRVAVLDEDGDSSEIPVIPLVMTVQDEPAPDSFTVYETKLRMRNKQHDLVVSIYDEISGRILSTKVEVAAK